MTAPVLTAADLDWLDRLHADYEAGTSNISTWHAWTVAATRLAPRLIAAARETMTPERVRVRELLAQNYALRGAITATRADERRKVLAEVVAWLRAEAGIRRDQGFSYASMLADADAIERGEHAEKEKPRDVLLVGDDGTDLPGVRYWTCLTCGMRSVVNTPCACPAFEVPRG